MEIVCINPSKQEWNIGVNGYGNEEDNAHRIGFRVKEILEQNGGFGKVYCTPKEMDLAEGIAFSNSVKATIHVDIHSDAGGGRGCTALFKSTRGKALATAIYNKVTEVTPTTDRGIQWRGDLGCLNQTNAVAALIEMFFHDSYADVEYYKYHKEEFAQAIARGIMVYAGVQPRSPEIWKVVKASALNVRSTPEVADNKIGVLKAGDKVRVGYVKGDWTNIYYGEHGGWVASRYLG